MTAAGAVGAVGGDGRSLSYRFQRAAGSDDWPAGVDASAAREAEGDAEALGGRAASGAGLSGGRGFRIAAANGGGLAVQVAGVAAGEEGGVAGVDRGSSQVAAAVE